MVAMQRRIVAMGKPVVTRLHGAVRAGGIGIVAASDIAISAADATYALTEVKLGLAPAVISLTVLPRLTSRAAALTCLTGEVFDGAQAAEMGLVTRAVPVEELDDAVAAVVGLAGHRRPSGAAGDEGAAIPRPARADRRAGRRGGRAQRATVRLGRSARGDAGVPGEEVAIGQKSYSGPRGRRFAARTSPPPPPTRVRPRSSQTTFGPPVSGSSPPGLLTPGLGPGPSPGPSLVGADGERGVALAGLEDAAVGGPERPVDPVAAGLVESPIPGS